MPPTPGMHHHCTVPAQCLCKCNTPLSASVAAMHTKAGRHLCAIVAFVLPPAWYTVHKGGRGADSGEYDSGHIHCLECSHLAHCFFNLPGMRTPYSIHAFISGHHKATLALVSRFPNSTALSPPLPCSQTRPSLLFPLCSKPGTHPLGLTIT